MMTPEELEAIRERQGVGWMNSNRLEIGQKHAPDDIHALLAEVDRLRVEVERLKAEAPTGEVEYAWRNKYTGKVGDVGVERLTTAGYGSGLYEPLQRTVGPWGPAQLSTEEGKR
jgi:hypothetical protein